jgi:hypothetical protein
MKKTSLVLSDRVSLQKSGLASKSDDWIWGFEDI